MTELGKMPLALVKASPCRALAPAKRVRQNRVLKGNKQNLIVFLQTQ
jgi:hypothetical protein